MKLRNPGHQHEPRWVLVEPKEVVIYVIYVVQETNVLNKLTLLSEMVGGTDTT